MQMQFIRSAEQTHAGDKSYQPEIVITVKVRDKYVIDLASADFVFRHLRLCSLAAINKKNVFIHGNDLRSRMTIECGQCRIIS